MQQDSVSDVLCKYFAAFLANKIVKSLEKGLSDDFTFTSPNRAPGFVRG